MHSDGKETEDMLGQLIPNCCILVISAALVGNICKHLPNTLEDCLLKIGGYCLQRTWLSTQDLVEHNFLILGLLDREQKNLTGMPCTPVSELV